MYVTQSKKNDNKITGKVNFTQATGHKIYSGGGKHKHKNDRRLGTRNARNNNAMSDY